MSARYVTQLVAEKHRTRFTAKHSLLEYNPQLATERILEDHEKVVEVKSLFFINFKSFIISILFNFDQIIFLGKFSYNWGFSRKKPILTILYLLQKIFGQKFGQNGSPTEIILFS